MRKASETRIKALEDELITVRGELSKGEADLNWVRARIRTAIADFKNSPLFENYIESRRRQWVANFHRSKCYMVEIQQATLADANWVLDKHKILHLE